MKFTIPKNVLRNKIQSIKEKRIIAICKWHDKFAWLPTKVNDKDDLHTYVWLEKYKRKWWRNPYTARDEWKRMSGKEFFKRKLAGDSKKDDDYMELEHDSTNVTVNVTGLQSGTRVYIKKADKNDHTAKWG